MRAFIEVKQLAATLTASAFTLIGPDVVYAGVCTQAEICVPKLCVRMMYLCCVSMYSYISLFSLFFFWKLA